MHWQRWQAAGHSMGGPDEGGQRHRKLLKDGAALCAEAAPPASAGANTGNRKGTPRVRLGKPVRVLCRKMRQRHFYCSKRTR
jgi:hypothetical protein